MRLNGRKTLRDGAAVERLVEQRTAAFVQANIRLVREIQERRAAEEALRESEERYRLLFNCLLNACGLYRVVTDAEGVPVDFEVVEVNPAFERLTGLAAAEVVGRLWRRDISPAVDPFWIDTLGRVALTGEPTTFERHSALISRWLQVSAFSPRPGKVAVVFVDITERRRMEDDLADSRERLEKLVAVRTSELTDAVAKLLAEVVQRKRTEKELQASNRKLRDLAAHIIEVREENRADIAREIHDELGQALTALKFDAAWIANRLPAGADQLAARARGMGELIDATIGAVQRITAELRPPLLDELGLAEAIEWQAREFTARTGIPCRVVTDLDSLLPGQTVATPLFRIFQESLTNIIRHAGASRVAVMLSDRGRSLVLRIADNGGGVSRADLTSSRSFGVMGMAERAAGCGGTLRIRGREGVGTVVRVAIPKNGKRR